MRPPAFKLLTLALTLFLLLSFSLSVFAMPIRVWLATRDTDEQPYPAASRQTGYFIVFKTTYGFMLIPVYVRPVSTSTSGTAQKSTDARRANEAAE